MTTGSNSTETSGSVKTFRGRTIEEILPQVRAQLGPEAIILREREGLVGGVGGFFAQRFVEVDARRGDGQSIDIYDDPADDDILGTTATLLDDPLPTFSAPTRRFETGVFLERLREASQELPDDGDELRFRSVSEPDGWADAPAAQEDDRGPGDLGDLEALPALVARGGLNARGEPEQPEPSPRPAAEPVVATTSQQQEITPEARAALRADPVRDRARTPREPRASGARDPKPARDHKPSRAPGSRRRPPQPPVQPPAPEPANPYESVRPQTPAADAGRSRPADTRTQQGRPIPGASGSTATNARPVAPEPRTTAAPHPGPAPATTRTKPDRPGRSPRPLASPFATPQTEPPGNRRVAPVGRPQPTDGDATRHPGRETVRGVLNRLLGDRLGSGAPARPAPPRELDATEARAAIDELTARGASEQWSTELIRAASAHAAPLAGSLRKAAEAEVARRILAAPALPATGAAIAFVGAGGSGKTRCTAALASAYRRASTLAVTVIALDNPDGARELKRLLREDRVPVLALNIDRARRTIDEARQGGLVIIDTGACSPTDVSAVAGLGTKLDSLGLDAVYVAIPATLGPQAARRALGSFGTLRPTAVAVTHADETDQLAVAVEIATAHRIPLAYLHTGTDHRTALAPIEPRDIAQQLLP